MPRQLVLLRHGEIDGDGRLCGRTDVPLTARGWQQMHGAIEGHPPWDRIVSSPLSRCAGFAAELARRDGVPLTHDARLGEIDFGRWEGCVIAELLDAPDNALARFWREPDRCTPPNGETLVEFCARVDAAWESLVDTPAYERVLVVTHAGVIRALFARFLGWPRARLLELDVPHAALYPIDVSAHGDVQPRATPGRWHP